MKSARLIAKAGLIAAVFTLTGAAFAQSVTASKDIAVTATLTSQCRVASSSSSAITLPFGTYVAFRGTALTATAQTVTFECTRGLTAAPSFQWDNVEGTTTGEGVLAGLRYSLSASAVTTSTGAAPDLATASDIGTPSTRTVTINGSMPPGQAGTDTSGQVSATRTLTVSF